MKKSICALFLVCSGTLACTEENPKAPVLGEKPRTPIEHLLSLEGAKGFDLALAQEKLFLTKEAIQSFDEVVRSGSPRAEEARQRRDALMSQPDPVDRWRQVLAEGDPTKMVRMFPSEAMRHFEEELDLLDVEKVRPLAKAFQAAGEPYPMAVLTAMEKTKDRQGLEEGLQAFRKARTSGLESEYSRAARLLERAGNPLYLEAKFGVAASRYKTGHESLPVLDQIAPIAASRRYRHLAARIHIMRGSALEANDNFFAALGAYDQALQFAGEDATSIAAALSRRSGNLVITGNPERAFSDALRALSQLPRVADINALHQSFGNASMAVNQLGHPAIALQYQNAAVETGRKLLSAAPARILVRSKTHLAIALRARADLHIQLNHDEAAAEDMAEALALAEAIDHKYLRTLFAMRISEVAGQAALKTNPAQAITHFDNAIELAIQENSTYRAVLHFKRATARRKAGNHDGMRRDLATALTILRNEGEFLRNEAARGSYEGLWNPYFARFQAMYAEMIESIIEEDAELAFVYAEQARAFEPLQLVLQSQTTPNGFRRIDTKSDLRHHLDALPADTVILEYLVLPGETYTWVLTRGNIEVMPQRATRKDVERWLADATGAMTSGRRDPFTRAMRAVYDGLFRAPLATPAARARTRIVIIPDGPMHGLPFAGLHGTDAEGYLVKRASIATHASASLYFYSMARDRQFSAGGNARVLAIGNPTLPPRPPLGPLPFAQQEVEELSAYYDNSEILVGRDATVGRTLKSASEASIIHFACHGIANRHNPSRSMLLLAPENATDTGELTAEMLMTKLSDLERTRLVVLAACSTAGGQPVGPEGLSPLVRPIVAANVPAVVGTLSNVHDATAKELLVSLHCHYRHGDDVAVALQHAQLERLQDNNPPMWWAPYQVVGYAGSPYPPATAVEKTSNELVCAQHSLHRPDGLRSQ